MSKEHEQHKIRELFLWTGLHIFKTYVPIATSSMHLLRENMNPSVQGLDDGLSLLLTTPCPSS